MPSAQDSTICRLASVTGLSLNVATKQTLYTVPPGKTAIIAFVVLSGPSGSAAAADAGFGGDNPATDFRASVQFDNLVTTTDAIIVMPDDGGAANPVPGKVKQYAAGAVFGIDMGTLASVTCRADVFGYEF